MVTTVPDDAPRSEDGYWWWDGQQWQPVEGGSTDNYLDGGALPGGTPEQQVCDCGPCPSCAEDRQMSSPCVYLLGHGGDHECAEGDLWQQDGPHGQAHRSHPAGRAVATAIISYNSSDGSVGATGNTTGWPRGDIWVSGDVTCNGALVQRMENNCSNATACTLPSFKDPDPSPGSHWVMTVTGQGVGGGPVTDSAETTVPD
ncbi:MAG TPA: hypothetical protein VLJ59_06455 [Mycobacteriales bacterium]|nr:hypothetical protein [Mycobacteriales bacterium]